NPGPEYEATRHNVGWWLLDHLAEAWRLGAFRREGRAVVAAGRLGDHAVRLVKPMTYMNSSAAAVAPLRTVPGFDVPRDPLVAVVAVSLERLRLRFRARGSARGHYGFLSSAAAHGTPQSARLRTGAGAPPPLLVLPDWALSPPSRDDEEQHPALLPVLAD